MKVSISILASELINLKEVLKNLDPKIIDYIHLDIMDSHFVPQLSFGENIAKEISQATNIDLDIHLMVAQPEIELPKYFDLKPKILTFHIEASLAPIRLARSIRERSILTGVSLNPSTPISSIEPILNDIDLILLMSVEPGYYGQKFLETSICRAKKLKELIGDKNIILEIDGGINEKNIEALDKIGVDIIVCGSSAFCTNDVNNNVQTLKKLIL